MNGIYSFYLGACLFFIVDLLQKITSRNQHTWNYIFHRSIFSTSVSIMLAFVFFGSDTIPSSDKMGAIMGACVVCTLGLYFYIKAVNSLHFANVGALSIVGNVFQLAIGYWLFHEIFLWGDAISMALMSVGCVTQISFSKNKRGALYVLASTFFWTIGYVMLSRFMQNTSAGWTVPIMEATVLLTSCMILLFQRKSLSMEPTKAKHNLILIAIGLLIFFASFMNNLAFQQVPVSVISILQLSLMPIGYILSLRIFRERPSKIELFSFLTGFFGFGLYVIIHWL